MPSRSIPTPPTEQVIWAPNPGACPGCGRDDLRGLRLECSSLNLWRCQTCGATTHNPTGPQYRFLASSASEVCYGGAAGGGKSAASIAFPLRWVHNPRFRCLFLRREAKYLSDALEKSGALYPAFGARLVQSPKIIWTFPSGATVWLNHCEHESDVANYDSLEFHLIIFEEVTHI